MTVGDVLNLVRPNIQSLKPYACARDEFQGRADVFLDANENSLGSTVGEKVNRYPDPLQSTVKQKIGALKNVDVDQIFLGNGSDEAIDLLFRVFCRPAIDNVILQPPTYGMYKVSADINDVDILEVALTQTFQPDVSILLSVINEFTRLIFFCSPNNPSGNVMNWDMVKELLDSFKGVVVVDEAYIDFSDKGSWLKELNNYPNLIVLQTFSKAWGMAGLRLGMMFAHPAIIELMNRAKPPYNVNECTQKFAVSALDNQTYHVQMIQILKSEKENLRVSLSGLSSVQKIFPSDANFLLVRFRDGNKMYRGLMERGVVVRNRGTQLHCDNCLRITVGKKEENEKLIETIKEVENT